MKKISAIILLLFYMIPSFGINVTIHYCGGEISSISLLGSTTEDKCACGIKKMKNNCCKDSNFYFQVDDKQIQAQQTSINPIKSFAIQLMLTKILDVNYSYSHLETNGDYFYHPPNKLKTPIYIFQQVFRI